MNDNTELKKGVSTVITEIVQYMPNAVVSKSIIRRSTGNITASSVDAGEEMAEKQSPFDTFIQIIDGNARLLMDDVYFNLALGDGIVIPAHARQQFFANEQFKMISTVIKSGYEL
jgi:quercetin dioxygenase-like cupin family protein